MTLGPTTPRPLPPAPKAEPGAEAGEEFAQTVAREVREETGVVARLEGLVSLRHAHARAFGQGDRQPHDHPNPTLAPPQAPTSHARTRLRLR